MTDHHDPDMKYKWEFWSCDTSVYMCWTIKLLAHRD